MSQQASNREAAYETLYKGFSAGFEKAREKSLDERRIGAELKFPLVTRDGEAVPRETVQKLWSFLEAEGWTPDVDKVTGRVVGASTPGPYNDTVASCETGYCKTEFSLAHVGNLFELDEEVRQLKQLLGRFAEREQVIFLAFALLPVTPPSKRLLMKKVRSSVWDKVFPSNRVIAPEDGDDVHMFTVNAGSHVHVSSPMSEAVTLVNVLCGFAGAQIGLMAHSNVWRGQLDEDYQCLAEKFWDWWEPAAGRVGIPSQSFEDLRDYVRTVADFKPVYVKRDGLPLVLKGYDRFADYYADPEAAAETLDGERQTVTPEPADFDLHNSCYWFNARLSRYYTVENRVFDQQPPNDLVTPAAITLGLASAVEEAREEIQSHSWDELRELRQLAMKHGLSSEPEAAGVVRLAERMLALAKLGLTRRGQGEETFLAPLAQRLEQRRCPATETAEIMRQGGISALLKARSLT